MKTHILIIVNLKFRLQTPCSFGDVTENVKSSHASGIPINNFLYYNHSLIHRVEHFLSPLESKQEAISRMKSHKMRISEVYVLS